MSTITNDFSIKVYTFDDKIIHDVAVNGAVEETIVGGHGGGDEGIVDELYEYLGDNYQGFTAGDIDISAKNHLIVFAAEKARRNGTAEDAHSFFEEYGLENN